MIQQLQIRQQPSILEIESRRAELSIQQPRPEQEIITSRADLQIVQPRPEMQIDQHDAWRAYNGGGPLEMSKQIYSTLPDLFLQGLAKQVEQGNRLADFRSPSNTIAEVYGGDWQKDTFVEFRGPASYDNVSIHVEAHRPQIDAQAIAPQITAQSYTPQIDFHPGQLTINVKQYASIEIIPPNIDMTM
jgi:hypothetical protein